MTALAKEPSQRHTNIATFGKEMLLAAGEMKILEAVALYPVGIDLGKRDTNIPGKYNSPEFRAILRSPEARKGLLGLLSIRDRANTLYDKIQGIKAQGNLARVDVLNNQREDVLDEYNDRMWQLIDTNEEIRNNSKIKGLVDFLLSTKIYTPAWKKP